MIEKIKLFIKCLMKLKKNNCLLTNQIFLLIDNLKPHHPKFSKSNSLNQLHLQQKNHNQKWLRKVVKNSNIQANNKNNNILANNQNNNNTNSKTNKLKIKNLSRMIITQKM